MSAIVSAGTGNWSDGTTWVGGTKPAPGDTVTIAAGHTVSVNESVDIGTNPANQTTFVLTINGWLKWMDSPSSSYTFQCRGNIQVNTGGKFSLGTASNPIPASQTATLEFPSGAAGWILIVRGHATSQAQSGVFEVYGNASHHMASASMQRAQLASAASLGTDVTIQLDKNVDWVVGDYIWLGQGGSATTPVIDDAGANIAGYGCEKVLIKTKTNASTYTVDLTYNHLAGDIAVHGTRNAIIKGATTQGFQIYIGDTVTWQQKIPTVSINWAQFINGGYGASYDKAAVFVYGYYFSGAEVDLWTGTQIQLKNTLFDTPYATATSEVYAFYCYGFYMSCRMTVNALDEVHTWRYPNAVTFGSDLKGMVRLGHVSYLASETAGYGVYMDYNFSSLKLGSFWGSAQAIATTLINGIRSLYNLVEVGSIKIHKMCYGLCNTCTGAQQHGATSNPITVDNGEFYNTYQAGIWLGNPGGAIIKNCKFAHAIATGFYQPAASTPSIIFDTCEFQNCARNVGLSSAGVYIFSSTYVSNVTFKGCKFGTTTRNNAANIRIADDSFVNGSGRIIMEDCEFKEPISSVAGQTYWPAIFNWAFVKQNPVTQVVRACIPRDRTFEFVRPKIYNAAGVDQWPVSYPGVTHLAIAGGGCEIRNEETEIQDGSLAIRMSPYNFEISNSGTYAVPVKKNVSAAGGYWEIHMWMKKNVSLPAGKRPRLCTGGMCLENAYTEMDDSVDTWVDVVVYATTVTGFVDVWVEPGCNTRAVSGNDFVPSNPGTVIVYADKLSFIEAV